VRLSRVAYGEYDGKQLPITNLTYAATVAGSMQLAAR
jgi:hypothetical protein